MYVRLELWSVSNWYSLQLQGFEQPNQIKKKVSVFMYVWYVAFFFAWDQMTCPLLFFPFLSIVIIYLLLFQPIQAHDPEKLPKVSLVDAARSLGGGK